MTVPFCAHFQVTWRDLDANNHMRNAAYLDFASQTRILFNHSCGFTATAYAEHGIGPVTVADEIEYRREMYLLQSFSVTYELSGMSESGTRFYIVNNFCAEDGTRCATVRTRGLWLDLKDRMPTPPPSALQAAMLKLTRTDDYRPLDERGREIEIG